MKLNDILCSSHGYNCTLVDFYKVVKLSTSSVWLRRLESTFAEHDGYGQVGHVVPTERYANDKVIMRRRKYSEYSKTEYIAISNYEFAYPWDGQPAYYNSMD